MVETVNEYEDGCFGAAPWVLDSLYALSGVYRLGADGRLYFDGERPVEEDGTDRDSSAKRWHGHGYFSKWLVMLVDGEPVSVEIFKHRWLHSESGVTVHSRPDDDPVLVRFCTLIVFLRVWAVVRADCGFHHRSEVFESLESHCGSDRTVQRWLAKIMEKGKLFHQAIRLAIIERSEPRPVERLFDGGLSPPHDVSRKRWKSPTCIGTLYQGFAMLFVAARELALHVSDLLAGARRRMPNAEKTFGI